MKILGKQTDKQTNGQTGSAKDEGVFRLPRPRGRKRGAMLRTKDFFRALSGSAWSAPHAPVLRRLHD